jgi:hypothetical protein
VRDAGYGVHFVTEKGNGTKFVIEPIAARADGNTAA